MVSDKTYIVTNNSFMETNDIEAYVKYNLFHKEQKRAFKNDIFRIENLYYNREEDYFVCPMGQHMQRIGVRRERPTADTGRKALYMRRKDAKVVH